MNRELAQDQITLRFAVLATLAAGTVGLALAAAGDRLGWQFPSVGITALTVCWKLATLAVVLGGFWILQRRTPTPSDVGLVGTDVTPAEQQRRWRPAMRGVGISMLLFLLVSAVGIGENPAAGSRYGEVHHATVPLVLLVLLVQYPLTVLAEEVMFRGWLYPRLTRFPIPISAALFAAYHLQQATTIPAVAMFGLALGFLRWQRGNIRACMAAHYAADAIFFLLTYAV